MATVLPGSPPGFDREDIAGTVRALCGYLRTFQDNLDFQLGQLRKSLESHGKSIDGLEKRVKALETGLERVRGDVGTLQADVDKLSARVSALDGKT